MPKNAPMAAFDTLIDFPDDGEEVGMFKLNILGGATDFNQRYSTQYTVLVHSTYTRINRPKLMC